MGVHDDKASANDGKRDPLIPECGVSDQRAERRDQAAGGSWSATRARASTTLLIVAVHRPPFGRPFASSMMDKMQPN
jgi:hypothetical protein